MKKLVIIAALLLASTAANAGNSLSLEIDGHQVRIEVPNNCDQLPCIKISAPDFGFKTFKSARNDADDVAPRTDPPAQKPAPTEATAPQPPAAPANSTPSTPPIASTAPAAAPTTPTPAVKDDAAPATAATAAPKAPAAAAAPVQAPTTPLGMWTVQDKGTVRIEACGANLCGYAVKTGEKVLIDMKPQDTKWTGQIRDPDTGRTYDSNIAMKGPNSLRVEGCAFGGMFCGGQTWSRAG
jgi:uncharacterized protein (DUF2147 family)